jgi:hypothetical protein
LSAYDYSEAWLGVLFPTTHNSLPNVAGPARTPSASKPALDGSDLTKEIRC